MHFVIDSVRADKLREKWTRADRGVALDFIDVSDRRLTRAATELVEREVSDPGTHVTVVLPRRSYSALLGRLLHDRTADKIAAVVSRIPRSAATIIPYDVESRVRVLQERHAAKVAAGPDASALDAADQHVRSEEAEVAAKHAAPPPSPGGRGARRTPRRPRRNRRPKARGLLRKTGARRRPTASALGRHGDTPSAAPGVTPIGSLTEPGRATVEGRIRVVEIRPVERNSVLACEISDGTGAAHRHVLRPLAHPGHRVRRPGPLQGLGRHPGDGHPVMINPAYELLFPAV